METTTYLIFNGNCREAMTFYSECLNAKLYVMTYAEAPGCENVPAEQKNKVIHARLFEKGKTLLMASDTHGESVVKEGFNFFVCIHCESVAQVEVWFQALSEKGKVEMPPTETFFAERFTMFTDQFGIQWMLIKEKKEN